MKKSISCKSPSKLNLFLDIKNKRKDGFHNIETVLEKVILFDKVTVEISTSVCGDKHLTDQISIQMQGGSIIQNENTAFKAASIFATELNKKEDIKIKISKKIPSGGGMGGASSNGAVVLKLLNHLFETELSDEKIISLGRQIGMDVPFFLKECNFGFGTGKGDEIKPLNSDLIVWHLLIYPGVKISTSSAYKWFDEYGNTLTKNKVNVKLFNRAIVNNEREKISGNLYNSFEKVVYKKNKLLSGIKRKLLQYGLNNSLLTGSGSTIYSLFFSRKEAIEAKEKIISDSKFPYSVYGPIRTMEESECKLDRLIYESGNC